MGFLFFPMMPIGLRLAALRAAGAPLSIFRYPFLATREKIISSDHCVTTDRTPHLHFSVQHERGEEQLISVSFSKQGTSLILWIRIAA